MKRILILSHKSPYAPLDGGVLAIRNFFEGLCKHPDFDVFMFCIETDKHKHNAKGKSFQNKCVSHYIDTSLKPVEAAKHLFAKKSYNLSRFYDKDLSLKIQDHLKSNSYDYILFESLFSTVYLEDLKSCFSGQFIYRSHNVEYKIWERLAAHEKSPLKKWYLNQLTSALKRYELDFHNKVDAIFSISKEDLNYYQLVSSVPCYLLFFIREQHDRISTMNNKAFFHLASMDWQPNLEAVEWFVEQVWKPVYKENKDLILYLAGKSMPEHYFTMENNGIKAFDYIEEGDTFMQEHGTLVVPLFTGSGIRIKVVDALSLDVPVLSTPIGVSGIGLEDGVHYLEAKTAEEFKQQILRIGKKQVDIGQLVKKSKIFASENFEEISVLNRFSDQLNQIKTLD